MPLLRGFEPGMGAWAAIGFRLSSGAVAELIRHTEAESGIFTLRVDRGADPVATLSEVLVLLGLVKADVVRTAGVAGAAREGPA